MGAAMNELLTNEEMARADRLAIEGGVSGYALMERAGEAVADRARRMAPHGRIVVVAGLGNNGGDGFVAARLLRDWCHEVEIGVVGEAWRIKGDAARALADWGGKAPAFDARRMEGARLVIDALFGAGLDRPVEGEAAAAITAINACGAPVLAVDLPSGVNGSSGQVMGVAVRAHSSVTFFRKKPGHVLLPGRVLCGQVLLADIGIPASVLETIQPRCHSNRPALWGRSFPIPRIDGHKYTRGHAVVVSGDASRTGAARLAARAALRAGAGLVTLLSPRNALAVNAASSTAVMVAAVDGVAELRAALQDRRRNVCVIGPGLGLGETSRAMVLAALAAPCSVVLDADALTSFADDSAELFSAIKNKTLGEIVITPHEGEYNKLFNELNLFSDKFDKLEIVINAARVCGAVALLKGADSVIAAPDGRAAINDNAPPWLASAGSGDVLAGFVGGLLAQGMPAFEAACAAVWLHGECGAYVGPGLIAEDLTECVPAIYRELFTALQTAPFNGPARG